MISPGVSECRGASSAGSPCGASQSSSVRSSVLSEVVAQLVGSVNAAFYVGELRVCRAGCAGFVFDVPEIEVGAVLAGDEGEPGVS